VAVSSQLSDGLGFQTSLITDKDLTLPDHMSRSPLATNATEERLALQTALKSFRSSFLKVGTLALVYISAPIVTFLDKTYLCLPSTNLSGTEDQLEHTTLMLKGAEADRTSSIVGVLDESSDGNVSCVIVQANTRPCGGQVSKDTARAHRHHGQLHHPNVILAMSSSSPEDAKREEAALALAQVRPSSLQQQEREQCETNGDAVSPVTTVKGGAASQYTQHLLSHMCQAKSLWAVIQGAKAGARNAVGPGSGEAAAQPLVQQPMVVCSPCMDDWKLHQVKLCCASL
jgi:hypothetical protein